MLHKWKKLIAIDKNMMISMIGIDDSKEGSHLWKMTGI
jgi:hypothetical protein